MAWASRRGRLGALVAGLIVLAAAAITVPMLAGDGSTAKLAEDPDATAGLGQAATTPPSSPSPCRGGAPATRGL